MSRLARQQENGAEPFKSGDIPSLAAAYLTNFLNRRGLRAEYINLFQDEKERLARMLDGSPFASPSPLPSMS